jgi:hypothetical protein
LATVHRGSFLVHPIAVKASLVRLQLSDMALYLHDFKMYRLALHGNGRRYTASPPVSSTVYRFPNFVTYDDAEQRYGSRRKIHPMHNLYSEGSRMRETGQIHIVTSTILYRGGQRHPSPKNKGYLDVRILTEICV